MSGAQDVLANAARRIGYYAPSDPQPGSEAGRYWAAKTGQAWLAGPSTSIWWCMLFVSMVFDEAGQVDAIGGFSYNTDVTLNRNRGRLVPVSAAQPGDVVIFNWNGGGTDHVGVVERNLGGGWLQTIEGNTSSGSAGSQSAGNGVWRRRRHDSIAAVIRPAWRGGSLAASSSAAPAVTVKPAAHTTTAALSVDGWWGAATTRRLQQVLGTPVDGVASSQDAGRRGILAACTSGWQWTVNPEGSQLITAMQKRMGISADGIAGPQFVNALEKRYGFKPDGHLDGPSNTVRAMQRALNSGRF